jgi:uncharacterized protein (TIGR03435 family)
MRFALCPFLLIATIAVAQAQAPPSAASTQQEIAPPIAFEAVSVRRNPAPMGPTTAHFDFPADGDGLRMTDIVLGSIIGSFYGFNQDSQSGLPEWADTECYDILAKVAPSDLAAYHQLTKTQRNRMVQAVLEERFHLRTHIEERDRPNYSLIVAKGGAKIKPAPTDEVYTSGPKGADGRFQASLYIGPEGEQIAHGVSMEGFAKSLKSFAGRQVVDHTGLTGKYDFTFKWNGNLNDPDAPSLFTALEEQLGLKLEPARGPVQVLVIDHIERPSEN